MDIKINIRNDGGPAFPQNVQHDIPGMSLRDYFAAKALQGMLAYPGDETRGSWHSNSHPDGCARQAYAIADAMLAERSKP